MVRPEMIPIMNRQIVSDINCLSSYMCDGLQANGDRGCGTNCSSKLGRMLSRGAPIIKQTHKTFFCV
jgi:hypothetical protein